MRNHLCALTMAMALLGACSDDGDSDRERDVRSALAEQLDVGADRLDVDCSTDALADCSVTFDDQRIPLGEGEAGPVAQALIVPTVEVEESITDHAADLGVDVEQADCGGHELLVVTMADGTTCEVTDSTGAAGTAVVVAGEDGRLIVVELTAG